MKNGNVIFPLLRWQSSEEGEEDVEEVDVQEKVEQREFYECALHVAAEEKKLFESSSVCVRFARAHIQCVSSWSSRCM